MSRQDELRLLAKVARLYYLQEIRQEEISERLCIHQSSVSRLLKRARGEGLVRFSVTAPQGTYSDLEDRLAEKYGLKDVVVIEGASEEESLVRDLGAAAAYYLETTLKPGTKIGVSSWSRSLFAMVESLHPGRYCSGGEVVQILGGVGSAGVRQEALFLAQRLANVIGAKPILLQAPAVVATAESKRVLVREPAVREVFQHFEQLDVALVGIGSMDPSRLLASSGNVFSPVERTELSAAGAVGDICFRYFDAMGAQVKSSLMQRVIGIEPEMLKQVGRVIGVAGGRRKTAAINAALTGKWINVLIVDHRTAETLAS
jgi:DNA-binding transcriptional regulator LsrR (DeoR family)